MNALMSSSKLNQVGSFGALLVALFSVSAVFYIVLSGGSVA
jgi:hypothetical protein